MKSKEWYIPRSLEKRLFDDLIAHLAKIIHKTGKVRASINDLTDLLISYADSLEWDAYAEFEAVKVVRKIAELNSKTWVKAAHGTEQSRLIHQILKTEMSESQVFHNLVASNSQLIKSVPRDVAKRITVFASKEAIAGRRGDELEKYIRSLAPKLTESHIRMIARTEIAKTQAAITQSRAMMCGCYWYVWETCQDQRVRSSHQHMQGVICNFSDPPAPEVLIGKKSAGRYGPGGIYNCRCYAAPIVNWKFIQFPRKVYRLGEIKKTSQLEMFRLTVLAA